MKNEIEQGEALSQVQQHLPLVPWRSWRAKARKRLLAWQAKRFKKRQHKKFVRERLNALRQIKLNEKGNK